MARVMAAEKLIPALAYLRTSSAQNVGGDSDVRQRMAIERYAGAAGYELVGEFYDAAVSGADPVESRPGFAAMLDRIEGNGVRVVLIEDASRFARSILAQELGVVVMQTRGVRVLTANGDDLTADDDAGPVAKPARTGYLNQARPCTTCASAACQSAVRCRSRNSATAGLNGFAMSLAVSASSSAACFARSWAKSGARIRFSAMLSACSCALAARVSSLGVTFTTPAASSLASTHRTSSPEVNAFSSTRWRIRNSISSSVAPLRRRFGPMKASIAARLCEQLLAALVLYRFLGQVVDLDILEPQPKVDRAGGLPSVPPGVAAERAGDGEAADIEVAKAEHAHAIGDQARQRRPAGARLPQDRQPLGLELAGDPVGHLHVDGRRWGPLQYQLRGSPRRPLLALRRAT